jgi:hypothetical protein
VVLLCLTLYSSRRLSRFGLCYVFFWFDLFFSSSLSLFLSFFFSLSLFLVFLVILSLSLSLFLSFSLSRFSRFSLFLLFISLSLTLFIYFLLRFLWFLFSLSPVLSVLFFFYLSLLWVCVSSVLFVCVCVGVGSQGDTWPRSCFQLRASRPLLVWVYSDPFHSQTNVL